MVDGINRLFNDGIGNNDLKGILVGKTMSLSHILFVDDALLLCFGDDQDLRKSLLDNFCVGKGMEANFQK